MDAKSYLDAHGVEAKLKSAVTDAIKHRPEDPIAFIIEHLAKVSGASAAANGTSKPIRVIAESFFSMVARLRESPSLYEGSTAKCRYASLVETPTLMAGVWTCEPDVYEQSGYEVDEFGLILSGRLQVTEADGTSRVLVKDDAFFIPSGWTGRFDFFEDLSKLYIIMPKLTPNDDVKGGPAIVDSCASMLARLQEQKVDYTNAQTTHALMLERSKLKMEMCTCEPDSVERDGYEIDELSVMLSGRLKLTDADGISRELVKGDVFYIPKGWSGRWEVLEPISRFHAVMA